MRACKTLSTALLLGLALASPGCAARASAPSAPLVSRAASGSGVVAAASDQARAKDVLAQLAAKYRHLDGVTVSMGTTPNGEQAVAFYTENRIVISRTHTVSIERILAHEVWHVIDWRDNGRLDWGENLPPANARTYER